MRVSVAAYAQRRPYSARMRLIVSVADGEHGTYNGTPQFEGGGVLRIDPDDQNGQPVWLSPAYWREITVDGTYDPVKADYYMR